MLAREFKSMAGIAESVPIRRIVTPEDLTSLPEVADALVDDFRRLMASQPQAS